MLSFTKIIQSNSKNTLSFHNLFQNRLKNQSWNWISDPVIRKFSSESNESKQKRFSIDKPTLYVSLFTVTGLILGQLYFSSQSKKKKQDNSSSSTTKKTEIISIPTPFDGIIAKWYQDAFQEPTTPEEKKLWKNANLLIQEMRYQQAANVLANLARRYQKPIYLSKLGSCYDALGETAKAQACLERLMSLLPDDGVVRIVVGEWLILRNKKGDALQVLQDAKTRNLPIKLLPLVALLRADILEQYQRYPEAFKELNDAIELTKSSDEKGSEYFMKTIASRILIDMGKYEEASNSISSIEKLFPKFAKHPLIVRTKASGLWLQGKTEEAKPLFLELLQNPDADIYNDYGNCLMASQNWNEALDHFEKADQLGLKNSSSLAFKKAQCKSKLGKYDEALKELEKVTPSAEVEKFIQTIHNEVKTKQQ